MENAPQIRIVKEQCRSGSLLVELTGVLDRVAAGEFHGCVDSWLDPMPDRVELDLRRVSAVTGAGLRSLLELRRRLPPSAALVLTDPTEDVRELLALTGMDALTTVLPERGDDGGQAPAGGETP